MKKIIINLPIRLKLTAAIVTSSFLLLTLFCCVIIAVEIFTFRSEMVDDVSILANLLSTSSTSALISHHPRDATTTLGTLKVQHHIRAAYIFDEKGAPFAQYFNRKDAKFVFDALEKDFSGVNSDDWQANQGDSVSFGMTHLSLFSPIMHQGNKIGTIYILSDNKRLFDRLYGLLLGVVLALGVLVALSLLIARYLSAPIANPLLELVAKMGRISRENDFSIRAEKRSNDEVGTLVDGFNDMLTQIEIRDSRISDHQKYLENTVSNRTIELQETVAKLEKARHAADSANQAKSQFLANMTHELRTPLIGVLGMNELLSRTDLNDQQLALVDTVQRSGEDLLSIISDILDFSKIEAGHLRLENVEVDFFSVVEETTQLLAEKAAKKGLVISCQVLPSSVWKVISDPVRLRQILLNLIGNAIKFTSHGSIAVRLDMTEAGNGYGRFLLEIEDTGVGMSEEVQSKVLSAFVQADSTTTRKHGGTGLGLAIVQQLIDLMEGKLNLESHEGAGTVVKIELTLPLVSNELPELPSALRGRRVLVCDDGRSHCAMLPTMLSALGMQVVTATSAEDAWYQLLHANRHKTAFDFSFIPLDTLLSDHNSLIEAIAGEPTLSPLRTVWVCSHSASFVIKASDSELLLKMPVRWSDLSNILIRSWKRIELVSTGVAESGAGKPNSFPGLSSNKKRYKILVADDNKVARELVCLSLEKFPLDADQVNSGTAAINAIESNDYDLVLMDCNMPVLDGIEATRKLRHQGCQVPVIAMTAHVDPQIFDSCAEAGMNSLLRKPFRQKELHDKIREWIDLDMEDRLNVEANGTALVPGET